MVERFSKKLLFQIEDLKLKGNSIKQIAKSLNITHTDAKKGLNKTFEEEMKEEN